MFKSIGFNLDDLGSATDVQFPDVFNTDTRQVEELEYPSDIDPIEWDRTIVFNREKHRYECSQETIDWWKGVATASWSASAEEEIFNDYSIYDNLKDNFTDENRYYFYRNEDEWISEIENLIDWSDLETGYASKADTYEDALKTKKELVYTINSLEEDYSDSGWWDEDTNLEIAYLVDSFFEGKNSIEEIKEKIIELLNDRTKNLEEYVKKVKSGLLEELYLPRY